MLKKIDNSRPLFCYLTFGVGVGRKILVLER